MSWGKKLCRSRRSVQSNTDAYQRRCHSQRRELLRTAWRRWPRLRSRCPGPAPPYPDTVRARPGETCTHGHDTQPPPTRAQLNGVGPAALPGEGLSSGPVYGPVGVIERPQLRSLSPEAAGRGEQPQPDARSQALPSGHLGVLRNEPADALLGPTAGRPAPAALCLFQHSGNNVSAARPPPESQHDELRLSGLVVLWWSSAESFSLTVSAERRLPWKRRCCFPHDPQNSGGQTFPRPPENGTHNQRSAQKGSYTVCVL